MTSAISRVKQQPPEQRGLLLSCDLSQPASVLQLAQSGTRVSGAMSVDVHACVEAVEDGEALPEGGGAFDNEPGVADSAAGDVLRAVSLDGWFVERFGAWSDFG